VGVTGQLAVERVSGGKIVAERLFDDDALPAFPDGAGWTEQVGFLEILHGIAELAGRDGEVEQKILPQVRQSERGQALLQSLICGGIGEVAHAIDDVLRELVPDGVIDGFGA